MARRIRTATLEDGAACAAIYAPYVAETPISFEEQAPGAPEMARRIARAQERHTWLVLEEDAEVVGYAYGGAHNARAAYRWACEVSVYVARACHGRGAGRALYEELFAQLVARGYRTAVAGLTVPNAASFGLHTAMGFEPVGVYRAIGFKDGRWHDVAWLQRALVAPSTPLREPV